MNRSSNSSKSSKRYNITPYTTASRYIPPEIRKAGLNKLMQVRNDPVLTLAVSSVNKNARSRAIFPMPKNITSYYKNAAEYEGKPQNQVYSSKTPKQGLVKTSSVEKYLKRFSRQDKKNRFYLFKMPFLGVNNKVPNIYKELLEAIRKQELVQSINVLPFHENSERYKNRYIGLLYDAAQPKRKKKSRAVSKRPNITDNR